MASILVAASPQPRAIVERILAGHDLTPAGDLVQAKEILSRQAFDMIVCTILFDESRMFDLLQFAKSNGISSRVPFVCARVKTGVLREPIAIKAVGIACQMEAACFLDIGEYGADPEPRMRIALELFLRLSNEKRKRANPAD